MEQTDVLIAGAGPAGMVLALWLNALGVRVRIVDKTEGPGTTSRALVIQARTLELYRQLDLTGAVLDGGHRTEAANIWIEGKPKAHLTLGAIGQDLTPYPYLEIFPQDAHERLLEERLRQHGVIVERRTELIRFTDHGGHVSATLRGGDGSESACEARYLAGCDGAHSTVRKSLGIDFPGGTYPQVFYVADVEASGPAANGELHVDLDESDFLAVFPMSKKDHARLVGTIREERAGQAETLQFDDVSERVFASIGITVHKVNWFATYHVHHRVASAFRQGRAFLLGDAGHIHSPAGGQGMNTGIGDAINLAWKLAAVLKSQAGDALLDTYETERIGFARRLVETTDRVFTLATSDSHLANIMRTRIAPALLPLLTRLEAAREFMFHTVSQTVLNYRGSALSAGTAGEVHGGDRLPWAPTAHGDNFAPLSAPVWQVHIYGTANAGLAQACARLGLPLHIFPWDPKHHTAGLKQDAFYLIRPDTYVACADPAGSAQALERYFASAGIRPAQEPPS
jgi:2-polyprenyl-6-methoxyphenol hydroxylase-like FAD-dependent oxidoreductase